MTINVGERMKKRTINKLSSMPKFGPFIFLTLLCLNYNNCSSSDMSYSENPQSISSTKLDVSSICSMTEKDLFATGYHQFLKVTCNNCHISGPGTGSFAHPDVDVAFQSFQSLGYQKISQNAVSDNHNYPYTGSHNMAKIKDLKDQWQLFETEKAQCGSQGTSPTPTPTVTTNSYTPKFMSLKKIIPTITGVPQTVNVNGTQTPIVAYNTESVQFSLDTDFSSLTDKPMPDTGGAVLTLSITGFSTPTGSTGYVIARPKLKTGTKSLHFQGMHIYINGKSVAYALTFQNVDKSLYQGTETMLSGGSMLALGPLEAGDEIAVSIGNLDAIEMAAPPAPPSVQFETSAYTLTQNDLGYANPYKVAVSLSGNNTNPVTVALSTTGDETKPEVAHGLLGPGGRNRFDWDYRIISPMSLTFLPGETTKYIEIVFSDDKRDDPDKTFTLTLSDPFGATLGTNNVMTISIPDFNDPPAVGEITFSALMKPGGILEMNCVRCHNSIDMQGGYDMTDYKVMVEKGIIVPGDPVSTDHKLFRRMNADSSNIGTITPMPVDGFLEQQYTLPIEAWLNAGAKNN